MINLLIAIIVLLSSISHAGEVSLSTLTSSCSTYPSETITFSQLRDGTTHTTAPTSKSPYLYSSISGTTSATTGTVYAVQADGWSSKFLLRSSIDGIRAGADGVYWSSSGITSLAQYPDGTQGTTLEIIPGTATCFAVTLSYTSSGSTTTSTVYYIKESSSETRLLLHYPDWVVTQIVTGY